jgi:hypothetical protein
MLNVKSYRYRLPVTGKLNVNNYPIEYQYQYQIHPGIPETGEGEGDYGYCW